MIYCSIDGTDHDTNLSKYSKKKKKEDQSMEKHYISSDLITIAPNIFGLCQSISHFLNFEWVTVTPIDKKLLC